MSLSKKNNEQEKFELQIKEQETNIVIKENKVAEENKILSERKAYLLDKDSNVSKRRTILNKKEKDFDKLETKMKELESKTGT